MALADLATSSDLSARGIDVTDTALVAVMLAAASAAVREAAGAPISETDSTITLEGGHEKRLHLPGQPVTAVDSVTIDGVAVTDYKFVSGSLWRACGWRDYYCEPSLVEVTMTHGYATVPADIVQLVCDFAIAGLNNATEGVKSGVASEAIDDYRVAYVDGGAGAVFDVPERTAAMLRARFGGGVYVTSESS